MKAKSKNILERLILLILPESHILNQSGVSPFGEVAVHRARVQIHLLGNGLEGGLVKLVRQGIEQVSESVGRAFSFSMKRRISRQLLVYHDGMLNEH